MFLNIALIDLQIVKFIFFISQLELWLFEVVLGLM